MTRIALSLLGISVSAAAYAFPPTINVTWDVTPAPESPDENQENQGQENQGQTPVFVIR